MSLFSLRTSFVCFVTALSLSAASLQAQEVQVFSFQGSDGVPRGVVSGGVAISGGLGGSNLLGVDPNNRSALFNLLANESIRRELKLDDDQYAGVQKIMQESQKRVSEAVRANMAAGNNNLSAGLSELRAESNKRAEAAIEEILLPKQLERVRQLAYQVEITQLGLGESLISGRLGKEIDIHEDQKQHLTDKAAAIEAEAVQAIAKIRAAARAKLFAELAPDQRKKAEELLGPHFDYEEPNFAKMIRQRVGQPPAAAAKP
jgi:hypothetical protein